jgi:hypothetical protein
MVVLVISKLCRFQFGRACVRLDAASGHKEVRSLCLRNCALPAQLVVGRCLAIFRPQFNAAVPSAAPPAKQIQKRVSAIHRFDRQWRRMP